jgi:hypothetical protein
MDVSGQFHAPAALPSRERAPSTHLIRGWVNPRAGLDYVVNRKLLALQGLELRPSIFQPIASSYTDYSIQAPSAVQNEIDIMKCVWNKMAFNVHLFCNNKLKIKIKCHCFIYF